MDKDAIFYKLQSAFPNSEGKKLFSIAGSIWSEVNTWNKTQKKVAIKEVLDKQAEEEAKKAHTINGKRMTDEERADAVGDFLDQRLLSGEITAAEIAQLKDIQNLKQKDRDIIIQVVNYKELED